jgi:periplasmic divalent cation tolerance protein
MKKTSFCVVLITAPKGKEAYRLSELLLKRRLCACVNIIKGVDSFFWWKAKVDSAKESLMVVKTKQSLLPTLIKEIKAAHSYDVCEVIALPIIAGSKEYLDWVQTSCRKG